MSLVVWLPLNGDLHNQGLSNVTVTNNGATINNSGKIGKCYQFGAASSYMTLSKEAMTSFTTEASVCFWLNILSWNTSYATYFQAGLDGLSYANYIFGLLRNSTTSACCFTISNGSTSSGSSYLTPTLSLNTWYHIALIYKTGHCLIYINGQLYQNYTTSIVPNFSGITKITIGTSNSTGSYQSNCLMNDVRIYNHALSPKEIEEISKGLVLHYKLDNYWLAENILTNSSGYQGATDWFGLVTASNENGRAYLIAKRTDTTSTSRTFCQHRAITSLVSSWQPGDKFTISGWYKVPSSEIQETGGNMFIRWTQSSSNNSDADTGFTTSTATKDVWIRFENTYTTPPNFASGKPVNFYLSAFAEQKRATVYWKDVKLEKGDKATPWCPATSDTLYTILSYNSTTIYDSSGYSNNGTIVSGLSAAAPSPRYDVATQFPGNALIEAEPLPAETKTISAWIKWNSIPSGSDASSYTIPLHDKNSGLAIGVYRGGTALVSYVGTAAGGTGSKVSCSITTNTWYHIVVVKTGDTTRDVYINNVKQSPTTNDYWSGDMTKFHIGCRHAGGSYSAYLDGQIVDVRAYATALSAQQIKELYTTSMQIDSSGNVFARELVEL